jgi:hypothetical protein
LGAYERVAGSYNEERSYAAWVDLLAELAQLQPGGVALSVPDPLVLPPHAPRLDRGYPKPAPPPPPPPTLLQRIRRAVARRLPGGS